MQDDLLYPFAKRKAALKRQFLLISESSSNLWQFRAVCDILGWNSATVEGTMILSMDKARNV